MNAKWIVKYVDSILNWEEICRAEALSFSTYFFDRLLVKDNNYAPEDIVSTLLLKLKSHIDVDKRNEYDWPQKYSYVIKVFRNLFTEILKPSYMELYISEIEHFVYQMTNDWGIYDTKRDIAAKNFVKEINKYVSKLPTIDQDVYRLCLVEGYTHKEAGKVLGISGERVRQYLVRLKKKLLSSPLNVLYNKYQEWYE